MCYLRKNNMQTIGIFFRSCLFSVVMIVATVFYSFFCVLMKPAPAKCRYAVIKCWMTAMVASAKYICGIKYQVCGLENIPKENGIIFSKHQSTWETFYLPLLFNEPTIILKKELLRIPFFGWGLSLLDPIAIDRKNTRSALDQIIEQGRARLRQGRFILCFPEGARVKPGEVVRYKIGGGRLAEATRALVTPVAHNAGECWPRKGFMKKPGTIHVVIGPSIDTRHKTATDILMEAQTWIEATMRDISKNTP
jgi:1-acyl-sn-glycerol-3-phosphate acyltransferase